MALAPGTHVGPYAIDSPLGAGGMGEVYRAHDARLNRDVALKVLPPAFSSDPERLVRFRDEARAAAALNHPNILAIYDIGEHDGAPYIAAELLDGETLRARLSAGPLSVVKVVECAVQICQGLATAHDKGIIHRDLKPENVFLTCEDRIKILDFGLAKLTQREPATTATASPTIAADTMPGMVLGTAGYMSPEQVRGQTSDHRSDVFAFGAVLYEMLSGRRAFQGETSADTMSAILVNEPAPLDLSHRQIPRALNRIVGRCLEKKPEKRFQSTSDLVFALEALSSEADPALAPSAAPRVARRRWLAPVLIGVALIGALSAAAVTYLNGPASDEAVLQVSILPPPGVVITDRAAAQGGVPARRLAISPDGHRLAFTAAGPDRVIWLWVRRLDAQTAQRLEGTEGAVYPFWSPDSQFIGFFSEGSSRRSRLMKIDASGGTPTTVCELAAPNSTGGTWSRDGTILFGTFGTQEAREIQRVSAAGGTPSPATSLDTANGEVRHYTPYFLPDGRRFLYLALRSEQPTGLTPAGLWVGSLDSNERTLLVPGGSIAKYAAGQLLFLRGTSLMAQRLDLDNQALRGEAVPIAEQIFVGGPTGAAGAFSVSDNGRLVYLTGSDVLSRLTWFDRGGKQIGLLGEPEFYGDLALSPDGSRVAATIFGFDRDSGADVWVYDVLRGLRTRLTSDPAVERGAVWSPDGQRIVFSSNRQGPSLDLYVKRADSTGSEEALYGSARDDEAAESWSPDGRFVAFGISSEAGPLFDLFVLPLDGDRKPRPLAATRFTENQARFSPDGRWVAYVSNDSGPFQVYVTPFPGPGARVQISTAGGQRPQWRRDGKEIFYVAPGNRLMAAEINESKPDTLGVRDVRFLFQLRQRVGWGTSYEVSPDGQRFLVNTLVDENASIPVSLIINWPALLKEQTVP